MSDGLIKYDAARKALQVAHSVDEVRGIKDKAEAVRAYARQAGDTEMQNWAVEIKLRAERRAGELLAEMKAAGILAEVGRLEKNKCPDIRTLPDLGLTRNQSADWQKAAKVPEEKFEAAIATAKETGELTGAAVRRALNADAPKPLENRDAGWRWRRVYSDFQNTYQSVKPFEQRQIETIDALRICATSALSEKEIDVLITEIRTARAGDHDDSVRHQRIRAALGLPEYTPAPPVAEVIIPDSEPYSGPPQVVFKTAELKRALARLALPDDPSRYDCVKLSAGSQANTVKLTTAGAYSMLVIELPGARVYGAVDDASFPFERLREIVNEIAEEEIVVQGYTLLAGTFSAEVARFDGEVTLAIPPLPTSVVAKINLTLVQRGLERVLFASPHEGKSTFCGAKIESMDGNLRLVATDGWRMALYDTPTDRREFNIMLPRAACRMLQKMNGKVLTISESEELLFLATELELLSHIKSQSEGNALMTGSYKQVILDTEGWTRVTVDAGELLASIKALRPQADTDKPGIMFDVANRLRLSAVSNKAGWQGKIVTNKAVGGISANIEGPPVKTKINVKLLEPFLERTKEELVTFYVKASTSAIDFRTRGGYRFLCMPLRLETTKGEEDAVTASG